MASARKDIMARHAMVHMPLSRHAGPQMSRQSMKGISMHTFPHRPLAGCLNTPEWLGMKAWRAGGQQTGIPTGAAATIAGHARLEKQQVHRSHQASPSCTLKCCQSTQAATMHLQDSPELGCCQNNSASQIVIGFTSSQQCMS